MARISGLATTDRWRVGVGWISGAIQFNDLLFFVFFDHFSCSTTISELLFQHPLNLPPLQAPSAHLNSDGIFHQNCSFVPLKLFQLSFPLSGSPHQSETPKQGMQYTETELTQATLHWEKSPTGSFLLEPTHLTKQGASQQCLSFSGRRSPNYRQLSPDCSSDRGTNVHDF